MRFSINDIDSGRLAISSWCWGSDFYAGRFSLLDMPERVAKHQIKNVELNDFMLPVPRFSRVAQPIYQRLCRQNQEVWRYRASTLNAIKQKLDQNGQSCICWTLNTDFTVDDVAWFGSPVYVRWGIQAAGILEADYLRIILGGEKTIDESQDEQIAARTVTAVRTMLKRLPNASIILENHWGVGTNIGRMMKIFLKVRSELTDPEQARFGICLDPVNMSGEDSKELEDQWDLMLPYAQHAHLKLSRHSGEPIALDRFVQKLQRAGYSGHFVIEDPHLLN